MNRSKNKKHKAKASRNPQAWLFPGLNKWFYIPLVLVAILVLYSFRKTELPQEGILQKTEGTKVDTQYNFMSLPVLNTPHEIYDKNLKNFPLAAQDYFKKVLDPNAIEFLEQCKTMEEAVCIIQPLADPSFNTKDLTKWLDQCQHDMSSATWGGGIKFGELAIEYKLSALATYLIRNKGFKYDFTTESYLITKLIKTGKGNCTTLPVAFVMLAERFKLPVHLVTVGKHVFVRYDDGTTKINIECTSPKAMGVGTPDSFYLNPGEMGTSPVKTIITSRIPEPILKNTTTMKSLTLRESISVLFGMNMAYIDKTQSTYESQHAIAAAHYFNPKAELPILNMQAYFDKNSEMADNKELKDYLLKQSKRTGLISLRDDFVENKLFSFSQDIGEMNRLKYEMYSTPHLKKLNKVKINSVSKMLSGKINTFCKKFEIEISIDINLHSQLLVLQNHNSYIINEIRVSQ